MANYGLLIQLL